MGRSVFLPAPTGGINLRDPVLLKPENDAERLDNMVCEPGYVRNRGAETSFCDTGSGKVRTLQGLKLESGSEVFLAISTDQNFYNITTGTASDISATYDATAQFTDAMFQTCVYRHRIFGCNGVDRPFVWTGSGDIALAAWTGPASNATKLVSVQPYKSRLYFCEVANASIWYTTLVDAVTGALTEVPLDSLLHLGGTPVFCGSTSNRVGNTAEELLAIYTTEGEVLVYQGSYPGDGNWRIVGRYRIAKPFPQEDTAGSVAYRCFVYIDNKLYLITRGGLVGIHELLGGVDFNDPFQLESGKVKQAFIDDAAIGGGNDLTRAGAMHHSNKNYVVITLNGDANSDILVMNTTTKAWSRWTYVFAQCWGIFNNKLYYGTGDTGVSAAGKVYEIDVRFGTSAYDYYYWMVQHSSSFLGNPKSSKLVSLMQPLLSAQKTSGAESTSDVSYGIELEGDLTMKSEETDTVATMPNSFDYQVTSSAAKFNNPVKPLVGAGKSVSLRLEDIPTAYSNLTVQEIKYFGSWLQVEDTGGLT